MTDHKYPESFEQVQGPLMFTFEKTGNLSADGRSIYHVTKVEDKPEKFETLNTSELEQLIEVLGTAASVVDRVEEKLLKPLLELVSIWDGSSISQKISKILEEYKEGFDDV